jgi:hypothetical protein
MLVKGNFSVLDWMALRCKGLFLGSPKKATTYHHHLSPKLGGKLYLTVLEDKILGMT